MLLRYIEVIHPTQTFARFLDFFAELLFTSAVSVSDGLLGLAPESDVFVS